MKNSVRLELIILLLSLVKTGCGEGGSRVKTPMKRSYQLPQVAVVNDPQGLQYYAAGPLYTIPTVLIPNQVSLSAAPIASVVIPPTTESKPAHEFQDASAQVKPSPKPAKISVGHYFKPKHHRHPVLFQKRPSSYLNSVHGFPVRMKSMTSLPSHKIHKASSVSIQPSVDLSGQYGQEAASDLYPTTVGPPASSTYGPPKAVDFQHKTRPGGIGGQNFYQKLKGPSYRHSFYPSKKMRVYSHVHKDHVHNHYLPAGHSYPSYKLQQPAKYAAPAYLPPVPSTPTTFPPETASAYPYRGNGHVRFPEVQESQEEGHKSNYSPGGVTEAIIKRPGVINNYDANIPLQVPSKKPYQFEVNEILKNSALHFVQETPKNNEQTSGGNAGVQYQTHKVPYQNALVLGTNQQYYTPVTVDQAGIVTNPLDIYNLPGVGSYQSNHIFHDQDLGTSETVKVPVAVIRGAHNIAGQGMFGFTVKRQDDSSNQREDTKKFTPSKRTSDWIPMSGSGIPLVGSETASEKQTDTAVEMFSDEYYSESSNQFPKKETKSTVRQTMGDIISGKIPEEYSPKAAVREGFVSSSPAGREKRKGSVIDVYPSAGSDVLTGGETSDLVVSSVIKFS